MNPTIDLLKNHRSIRKFSDQSIDNASFEAIINAGQAAASSSFIQAASIIRITDPAIRQGLMEVSGNQSYVAACPEFLVFVADLARSEIACQRGGAKFQAGFSEQLLIATSDVALVAQNCVIAAESLGLGICYIGALRNDPARVSELLDLPDQCFAVFGLCIGWPAQDPQCKPRLPQSCFLHQNSYKIDDIDAQLQDYDQTMAAYYQARGANIKLSDYCSQIANIVGHKETRPHILEFLQSKGFATR